MRISVIVASIMLALLTNVSMAWWCALHNASYGPTRQPEVAPDGPREEFTALGWAALPTWPNDMTVILQQFHTDGIGVEQVDVYEAAVRPGRSALASGVAFTQGAMTLEQVGTRVRAGWPMRALRGVRFRKSRAARAWSRSMALDPPALLDRFRRTPERVLPLEPMGPGFVVNTVVYMVFFTLFFALLGVIRGWWRIVRGRCPRCAYPVTAGTKRCSECGRPRPRRAMRAAA